MSKPIDSSSAVTTGGAAGRLRMLFVLIVSGSTMLSRVLGMARDMLQTYFLSSAVFDAFDVAYTFPNLFRRLFGEGALSAAFVPVLKEELEAGRMDSANKLINVAATLIFLILAGLVAAAYGIAILLHAVCPEYKQSDTLFHLLYIMLPYLLFICMAALMAAALNALHHFSTPALMPVLLNICMIAALLFVVPTEIGVYGLGAAVVVAGLLQVIVQVIVLRKKGVFVRPCAEFGLPQINKIIRLMLPVVLGLAVMQINVMFDRLIAYIFVAQDGANKVLYIGNRLMQLPLGVFGIAIATVIFPEMAGHAARRDDERFLDSLQHGLRLVCFTCIPAGVGLILLGRPIIELLFEHGKFVADDTFRATRVLILYSVGLWAFSAVHVVVRAFYSLQDTKTPVKVSVGIVILNLILNLILVHTALREGGLALATSICSVINLTLLLHILRSRKGRIGLSAVVRLAGKIVVACVPMVVVCIVLFATALPEPVSTKARLVRVLLPMAAGAIAFLAAAVALRIPELKELASLLRRR